MAYAAYAYLKGTDRARGRRAVAGALAAYGLPRELGWFGAADDWGGAGRALVYVALDQGANLVVYDVVVRGTNPLSLESWWSQDLDIGVQVPWSTDPGHGKISRAAATALAAHEALEDHGQTVYAYLDGRLAADRAADRRSVVRFSGHSLGGLLAPLLALRFAETRPPTGHLSLEVYSFAAPTAGNRAFAAYLERILSGGGHQHFGPVRFLRCQEDVAVLVWNRDDLALVPRATAQAGLPFNRFLFATLGALQGLVQDLGYTQPFAAAQGAFDSALVDRFLPTDFAIEDYLDGGLRAHYHRALAETQGRPSLEVFRHTLEWLSQAVVVHVMAYASHLLGSEDQRLTVELALRPILTRDTFTLKSQASGEK